MPPPTRSVALRRSVSSQLLRAEQLPVGGEIWIENEVTVWALAVLDEQDNTMLKVRRRDTGKMVEVDLVSRNNSMFRISA